MGFDFTYPTPLPSTKGWGPGWPDCQRDKITPHAIFQGGLRDEIVELVDLLIAEMKRRGYKFQDGWSWGFGCRSTKGGSGEVPSFHSWGLALDINAPINPFGGDAARAQLNQPEYRWVITLMREYGFFWLGPSIKDWMHFSFCGTPADAKAMTEKARRELGTGGGDDEVAYAEFKKGWRAFEGGKPEPAEDGDEKFGWNAASFAANRPKPGDHKHDYAPVGHTHGAHTHTVKGTAS